MSVTRAALAEVAAMGLAAQIACVRREISMRERVYPRWVQAKRMTQAKADSEIAAMRAVLDTLEGLMGRLL